MHSADTIKNTTQRDFTLKRVIQFPETAEAISN